MGAWPVLAISAAYLLLLFAVAWWGDRRLGRQPGARPMAPPAAAAVIYALTLAVYNTSWSFYGSVGRAATGGLDFLTIYLGPLLVLWPGRRVLARIIQVAKAQNVTSVSDFIAARYGKSGAVAATVTLVALLATLPYIALQLKAIAGSYDLLVGAAAGGGRDPFWRDAAFAATAVLALFAVLFGVRHVEASERHRGLMLAIAFESLVKLLAFLAVAAFIVFGIGGGPAGLLAAAPAGPALLRPGLAPPAWIVQTAVAALSFLCLPHAFHVAVVENEGRRQVRVARWLFPLYLACLSVAMLPVALVGLETFGPGGADPDSYMIALPLHAGDARMATLAFLGGLSAGTGMVIVAAVALSTMICNDVVMPLLMRLPQFGARTMAGGVAPLLLRVRRLGVMGVLLLSYLTYRLTGRAYPLTQMGLMSFVAVAQLGPGCLGALYWRRATGAGVLGGLAAGLLVWVYALVLPSLDGTPFAAASLPVPPWLDPRALFGIRWSDPVSHAAFWSLTANCLVFAALSLVGRQTTLESSQSRNFALPDAESPSPVRLWRAVPALSDLEALAGRYLGRDRGEAAFRAYLETRRSDGPALDGSGLADRHAVDFTETLLAGAVGAASARVIIAGSVQGRQISRSHAMAMLGEASEAIGARHRILAGALESVVQGICVMDADLRVVAWNQCFVDLLGLPADLVKVGLPIGEVIRFNSARGEYDDAEFAAQIINQDRSRLDWPYSYERQRPDGTVLDIVYNRLPDRGCIATFTDVTERHRVAAALREANERLELRVRERTEDLQLAKAQAEQANAAKTRFLAAASHDLLQPLNAARLFASALREEIDAAEAPARQLLLSNNLMAAIRSTEFLLNDLLDISSLDSGAVKAEHRSFPIGTVLGELAVEFAALAHEQDLSFRLVPCSAVVRSDPGLLRRILQNLLSNAVRYTRSGGVLVGARRRGGLLRICVYDTGPGIAPEHRSAIFEEFKRLPGAEPAPGRGRGLGLGLAIVERTAGLLGHEVSLRSAVGRGSCFSVAVPLGEAALPAAAPEPPSAADLVSGLRVLCVDNEPSILMGMKALMEPWGCRVATSADGGGADGETPDVLLVDYHLERGNGLDLIQRLRGAWGRDVPAALVTADRSEAVRRAAAGLDCRVLPKPVKPASLRRYLASVALRGRDAPAVEGAS